VQKAGSGLSVCDGKDQEFNTGYYQICCLSNRGQLPGHFLKIEGNQVTANASKDEETCKCTL
jgi:hypothetical protein